MTKTVHRSARSRTAPRSGGPDDRAQPYDPDPAGAVTPATRQNWAICTIAVREVDEDLVRTESAIGFPTRTMGKAAMIVGKGDKAWVTIPFRA
jgi:hypothetical protein